MTIQSNINRVEKLKAELKAHCMCWELREEKSHLTVEWPYKVGNLHGIRVSVRDFGKIKALEMLIERCEQAWKEDNAWWLQNA